MNKFRKEVKEFLYHFMHEGKQELQGLLYALEDGGSIV